MKMAHRIELARKATAELGEAIKAYESTARQPGSLGDLAAGMGRLEAAVLIAHARLEHALGK